MNDSLMGVVLCGGESRRMGHDKGRLLKEGMPWAQYMARKLIPFGLPVVWSVNAGQLDSYPAFLPADQLVPDNLPIAGPLKGLLSVHERFPSNDLLLLACDMLDLDEPTIGEMISAYRAGDPADFYVYEGAGFIQPFCGIYGSGGLSQVYARAIKGDLHDLSLQSLLSGGSTKKIRAKRPEVFENYNVL